MGRLNGRVSIVTGGAKGIGRHYSFALAAEGARVMIADIMDGADVAAEIAAKHGARLAPFRRGRVAAFTFVLTPARVTERLSVRRARGPSNRL
jgi:NAD(P)-dependent dehydrogenase (short-subunit alcohol dehydrogenase family)